jgi:hypothetical protein
MVILVLLRRAQLLSSRSFQRSGEMAFRAICVVLLLSSLPIAGCGTVANLAKQGPEEVVGMAPFGGVRQDVSCIKQAENGECGFWTKPKSEPSQHPQVALMLFYAADLPLSLIGDVVTWPYTATYAYINQPIPTPPLTQAPPPPATQTPTPAGTQAPTPPGTQPTTEGRPQTYP